MWHLCGDPTLPPGPRAAIVISNLARQVAVAHQRVSLVAGFPVVWDYHVVLAVRPAPGDWRIWDLDSSLGLDLPLSRWIDEAFGGRFGYGEEHAPLFRVVAGELYRATLRSDRRHMKTPDGQYQAPPPPWPMIGKTPGSNLMRFVAMDDDAFVGEVCDRDGLPAALARVG